MKRYSTPALVEVGRVVELTQGPVIGDADGSGTQKLFPLGSVGFNL